MIPWISSRKSGPAPVAPEQERESKTHTSLALNVLFHQIRHDRKYHILDLGPALGSNVDFFSQFSCKLYIEDLYPTLTSFDFFSPEDGFSYDAVFDYLLPFRKATSFDIILFWDLLNYLERDECAALVRHLVKFSHPGTLLLALISTLKLIPERPIEFRILDQQHLLYESSSSVLRPSPLYQESDLRQIMQNFRVCNSFLLRHGIKEYLFLRD
ncbi:MAG: methyltransferase domain-containing protein [Acidobacteria bacterium]|nr:methyltransferase domain-containing protein [Acidobacteriota bacterium]